MARPCHRARSVLRSSTKRARQKRRYNCVRIADMTNLLRLTDRDNVMRSFLAVVVARRKLLRRRGNWFRAPEDDETASRERELTTRRPNEASCCALGAAVAQCVRRPVCADQQPARAARAV